MNLVLNNKTMLKPRLVYEQDVFEVWVLRSEPSTRQAKNKTRFQIYRCSVLVRNTLNGSLVDFADVSAHSLSAYNAGIQDAIDYVKSAITLTLNK